MKILYTNFHPRNGGGHATYIINLAQALQGEHQVTVATPGTSRLFAQASRIPGVRCVDTVFSTRPGPMMAEVRRLRHVLREGAFDIVHANGSADHRQIMLARMGLPRAPRIVWTKHNTMPVDSIGNRIRARFGTDGSIGVSQFVTRMLRDSAFRQGPIQSIPHGIDTNRFQPWPAHAIRRLRQDLFGSLPADALVLGSVGGTDRDKGWLTLAQAMARLDQAQRARVHLLVAGDPLQGALLDDFQRLGVGRQVLFPGLVGDPERILAACDMGFVLSLHEAFSFAAAESLAMGLPTLVSDAGGLPELVRDGVDGWIVPKGDTEAVHAWLLARLAAPLPPGMAQEARARALAQFALPVFAQRTLDFYRQVCA